MNWLRVVSGGGVWLTGIGERRYAPRDEANRLGVLGLEDGHELHDLAGGSNGSGERLEDVECVESTNVCLLFQ